MTSRDEETITKIMRITEIPGVPVDTVTKEGKDQGTNWEMISKAVNGATDLNIGLYKLGPNRLHPPHYHLHCSEFYYIVDGSCLVRVDEREVEAWPGTAIYIPSHTIHAVRTRADEATTLLYGFPTGDYWEAGTVWLEEEEEEEA